jgi:LPXTG-motif cell wall-anchored protein
MRLPWKWLGLAGAAGVATAGVVVVRKRRAHHDYDPEELRARLHERLAAVQAGEPSADRPGD